MKKNLLAFGIVILCSVVIFLLLSNKATTLPEILTQNSNMVTLHTSKGDIKIKLFNKEAPKAAENFSTLAKTGKYNNTIFHRVIKNFMIQGGDYENFNGTGGKSIWGAEFEDEISENLSHIRGMVSMANRGPNTNGSQFFIVHKNADYLDGGYSIFGQVVEGMEVVDAIAEIATDTMDKPFEDIKILSTTVK